MTAKCRLPLRFPVALLGVALLLSPSVRAEVSVALKGGQLAWQAGERPLGAGDQWLQVRDLARGEQYVRVPVTATGNGFSGAVDGLAFSGEWKRVAGAMELACTVRAEPPKDRAVIVRVALPVAAVGWEWWDDTQQHRRIEAGQHYARLTSWDGPRQASAYPCCAVSGPEAGLSLAVPLTEPRVYRLAYDASRQTLEAEFDLGLSPEVARFPARADFRLLVYQHDPAWGFRDAVDRYYDLFPQYAERRAKVGGTWLLGFAPTVMACPWDFGFRFDEGGETRAGYDCAHDILPFVYTEPWGKYEHFGDHPTPDHKPRYGPQAPLLSADQLKQTVLADLQAGPDVKDRHFGGPRAEVARALVNSAVERADGSWIWHHWTDEWSPNDWLSNLILDPDPKLPEPNRASIAWKYELDPAFETAKRGGGELGGIYLDSIASFIGFSYEDFRRDHWRVAGVPLAASYEQKAPTALHVFENYEFAVQVAQRMRAQGKYVMANTFQPYMQYFCPWLDMIGAGETGSAGVANDDYYSYLRAYGYRKPLSWMDYGFVNPKLPWEQKERGLQRCLFYAVHPGTGGFQNPAEYEPSRPLFRAYEPLIVWLDEAGWQPVTRARTTTPGVLVERYGPGRAKEAGVTFVALRNPGKVPVVAAVEVEPQVLPLESSRATESLTSLKIDNLVAWRLVADEPVSPMVAAAGKRLGLRVDLAADATEVVALGSREAVARLWLDQAESWLDRTAREGRWLGAGKGQVLRGGDFEEGLTGWGTEQPPAAHDAAIGIEERQPLTGKRSVKVESQGDKAFQALHQDIALRGGRDYLLRFKYRWTRPAGAAGTITPRFGVKGPDGQWVSDKYIYFQDLQPTGTRVATYEHAFNVPPNHSTGFFQFLFSGVFGTVWIDDVEIVSPEIEEARRRLVELPTAADQARAEWRTALPRATGGELIALVEEQETVYRRLSGLAAGLTDDHLRRSLLLPLENYAETLGRATEVLTGVSLQLGAGSPFSDAATGDGAKLACTLRFAGAAPRDFMVSGDNLAGGAVEGREGALLQAVTVKTAPEIGWGWQDVMLHARFIRGNQTLWVPRRATIRLHSPLEVGAVGPVSANQPVIRLRLRSWLAAGAPVKLSGRAKVGDQEAECAPVTVVVGEQPVETALPLPAELVAALGSATASNTGLRLSWRAETPGGGTAVGEVEAPVVPGATWPRLAAAPKLSGTFRPDEWTGATRLEGFVGVQDGKPAARPTTVFLGRDEATLYLACLCGGQPQPRAENRPHDGSVWEDDAVEVFLQPPGSEAYYHFAVNAVGSRYEAKCGSGFDPGWNADWRAQTGATADGWFAEIAIPLQALGTSAQGLWRANFGREEADTKAATCWSPTFDGFHTPGRFGSIEFR